MHPVHLRRTYLLLAACLVGGALVGLLTRPQGVGAVPLSPEARRWERIEELVSASTAPGSAHEALGALPAESVRPFGRGSLLGDVVVRLGLWLSVTLLLVAGLLAASSVGIERRALEGAAAIVGAAPPADAVAAPWPADARLGADLAAMAADAVDVPPQPVPDQQLPRPMVQEIPASDRARKEGAPAEPTKPATWQPQAPVSASGARSSAPEQEPASAAPTPPAAAPAPQPPAAHSEQPQPAPAQGERPQPVGGAAPAPPQVPQEQPAAEPQPPAPQVAGEAPPPEEAPRGADAAGAPVVSVEEEEDEGATADEILSSGLLAGLFDAEAEESAARKVLTADLVEIDAEELAMEASELAEALAEAAMAGGMASEPDPQGLGVRARG